MSRKGLCCGHHIICDSHGTPLAIETVAGNVHDVTVAPVLLANIHVQAPQSPRPRTRPLGLACDKGYDSDKLRRQLRRRGIRHSIPLRKNKRKPRPGRKPTPKPELDKQRWVVERTFSWLHNNRRLALCWDRLKECHLGFLHLAAAIIAMRELGLLF
jgi:transposase